MGALRSLFCSRVRPRASIARSLVLSAVLAFWGGCGSPLVGLECKHGFDRCGTGCFDLNNDEHHCGGCGLECAPGQTCEESTCTGEPDDAGADAASADASLDGGEDSGLPLCTGPGSSEDCTCDLGQLKCGDSCKDVGHDPDNCGKCNESCGSSGFCVNGVCLPSCEQQDGGPLLTLCTPECVDLQTDPRNCGACGHVCPSGICADGMCIGATAGHIIAMGDDLSNVTAATQRLLGNAVLMPLADPVQVLVFDEKTTERVKTNVQNTIVKMAMLSGRNMPVLTSATSLSVTFLLSISDVFVIQAQPSATNDSLIKNGQTWSTALRQFVKRGGVIVLMDAAGGSNKGTFQILQAAGLLDVTARVPVGKKRLSLIAPGDSVATAVPSPYMGTPETVGFDVAEPTVVVEEPSAHTPVLIHVAR
jgi:hypothetical protein